MGSHPTFCASPRVWAQGISQIGAMLCSAQIYDCIEQGSGLFQHGHTYLGHPVAAAAAHAVVSKLTEQGLVARAAEQGRTLSNALSARFGQHPHIGDIRGRGLFQGMEFVEDRDSKTPLTPPVNLLHGLRQTHLKTV